MNRERERAIAEAYAKRQVLREEEARVQLRWNPWRCRLCWKDLQTQAQLMQHQLLEHGR